MHIHSMFLIIGIIITIMIIIIIIAIIIVMIIRHAVWNSGGIPDEPPTREYQTAVARSWKAPSGAVPTNKLHRHRRTEVIKYILDQMDREDPNSPSAANLVAASGVTGLHMSTSKSDMIISKLLLARKASVSCSVSCSLVQPIILGSLHTRDPLGLAASSSSHTPVGGPGSGHCLAAGLDIVLVPWGVPSLSDSCPGGHGLPCEPGEFPASGVFPRVSQGSTGLRLPRKPLRGRRPCWCWSVPVSCRWFSGSRGLSISVISWSYLHFPRCRVSGCVSGAPDRIVLPDLGGEQPTVCYRNSTCSCAPTCVQTITMHIISRICTHGTPNLPTNIIPTKIA